MGEDVTSATATSPAAPLLSASRRRIVTSLLFIALAGVTLLNSLGRTPVDIKPEVYLAPWRSAVAYLPSWQANPELGFASFNVGLAPVAVLIGIMQSLGASAGLSAHLLRGVLAALLGWGTARLYRTLVDDNDDVGALTAAVVAVANPYTLVAGSTLGISLPLAVLPWQLAAVVYAVRQGGWRYPAVVALTFFAMTGMNAGVVPIMQGLAVPVIAFVVARVEFLGAGRAAAALIRSGVLAVAVSLYWVVPALSATASGTTVLANSESLSGIANVSSFAEVLRGLGIWPLYGSDQDGPWQPQFIAYLNRPVVVVASFALPVLLAVAVAVTRGIRRRVALWLIVPAVVVMVGLNPVASPSPFGRLLRFVFVHAPATAAFRTTNKIGAMYVMGLALLVAAGFATLIRVLPPTSRGRVCFGFVALLVAVTAPAWAGNLYVSFVDVPGYWKQAAAALDNGSSERVWFVPGEILSQYRWSDRRPDDISLSLLTRPSLVRTVIPVSGAAAANLLAAVDTGLQEGWLAPGTLSTSARYLGSDTVLLRNDQIWENDGGARPQVLQDVIGGDPGLEPTRNYGEPGQNVADARVALTPSESLLPPLQQWAVKNPVPVVRALPTERGMLVAGDGYALDELVGAGTVDGSQSIRYLGDLANSADGAASFAQAVHDGARIVLTDTNRRRTTASNTLTDGQGPLLSASQDPGDTRSLWNAADQTVLVDEGAQVTASQSGSVFGALPYTAAENALDGNPDTTWQFGDFHTGVGATLSAGFTQRPVPSVTVHTSTQFTHITSLQLTLELRTRHVTATVPVNQSGVARWTPPAGTIADHFSLKVRAVAGNSFNRLSISEIDIPGVRVRRVAKLPNTLNAILARTNGGAALVAATPIDLDFARILGTTATSDDDEETGLDRDFAIPAGRSYDVDASIAVQSKVSDTVLDRLAGANTRVTANSTSRLFNSVAARASQAVDGNRATAWLPGLPATGQSITVTAPRRPISQISLTQTAVRGTAASAATRVRIVLDGRMITEARAHFGTTIIRVPRQSASKLTIEILKTSGSNPAAAVRFAEIGFGGARMRFDPVRASTACISAGTLDGAPLRLHPSEPLATGSVVRATGCSQLSLQEGNHQLRSAAVSALTLNRLELRDTLPAAPGVTSTAPQLAVDQHDQTSYTIHATGGTGSYWLALGQSFDPRWRATADGHSLGPPQLLNGWEIGWRVASGSAAHTITVTYTPQRAANVAVAISAVALLGCALVATGQLSISSGRWRRRTRAALRIRKPSSVAAVRRVCFWPVAVVIAAVLGGWLAGVAMAATALWRWFGQVSGRRLAIASALAFAAVPALWLALRPDVSVITPALIIDNQWPGRAAIIGLVLLVSATVIDDGDPATTARGSAE